MKKLTTLLISLMLVLFPVAALCDHNIGTTVYVTTERLSDGTNETTCYSEDFTCLGNLTWMANGTVSSENFTMTLGSCRGYATLTLPVYSTEAENLYVIDGHCDSATLSGAWSYGCVKAGTNLVTYVDAVETNQATAETNADNRTGYTYDQILLAQSTINTNTNTKVANATGYIYDTANANTLTINTNTDTKTANVTGYLYDQLNADVILINTNTDSEVANATGFLYDVLMGIDLYVFQNSTRYCRLWGYTAWPATQTACLTRYVTGVGG